MKKEYSIIQKTISAGLLSVFLFAITPHNLIHEAITHHQETVDYFHLDTEVSAHHTHCKFLQVVIAPFSTVDEPLMIETFSKHIDYVENLSSFYIADVSGLFSLRAPPLS